ncbi:hypothetical protein [Streptomyces sp. NPDC057909]|uniref:hypothetical protein n=1 Tax=Streptomyces sp. NPDC057909 TaxID=3346277 RepID=UPI0036E9CA61
MSRRSFESVAEAAAVALGPSRTKDLAGLLARGHSRERALTELATPRVREAVAKLYEAVEENTLPCPEAAAYLRGYVAAQLRARDAVQVRTVWSGPSTPAVPVRATAESAARHNIEAGVLVRGGDAPQRAAEHIAELQRRGVLQPLHV